MKTEIFAFAENKNANHIIEQITIIMMIIIIQCRNMFGHDTVNPPFSKYKCRLLRTQHPHVTFALYKYLTQGSRGQQLQDVGPLEAVPSSKRIINYQKTDLRRRVPAHSCSFRSARPP